MALRRNDGTAQLSSEIFDATEISIPVPNHLKFEKEAGCHNVDVSDISHSFEASSGTDNEPFMKQHSKTSQPKEPTLHLKPQGVASTEQTFKNKQIDRSYSNTSSPTSKDKNYHQSFSKTPDGSAKEDNTNSVSPINEKLSKGKQSTNSSESELWEYLKRQDAKLDAIQEQVSRAITPSASCRGDPHNCDDENLLRTGASCLAACREELLIKCLLSQSEQIQKLQEQVDWLMVNSLGGSDKLDSADPLRVEGPNALCKNSNDVLEGFLEKVSDRGDSAVVMGREGNRSDAAVAKQSTSTMTSMTFAGSDKFVIRKKLTVVTDSSKYQKEVSAQCSYVASNEAASPRKVQATMPRKETPSRKPTSRSSGKSQKSTKSSPQQCKCFKKKLVGSESSDIASPDEEKIQPSPIRRNSPRVKGNPNEMANVIAESKIEKYIPNYENILKKVNEMITEKSEPVIPAKKTPKSISKLKSKKSPKTSPSQCTEKLIRRSSTSSSSSHDFTPEPRTASQPRGTNNREDESRIRARYGLSSPNCSVATMQYLESYGLVLDKYSDGKRGNVSKKKIRTSLPERYSN